MTGPSIETPASRLDLTLNEYAQNMVEDTVYFYAAIENLAEKYGVELTEEDEAAIEEERRSMEDSLGGPEAFEDYLQETGLSLGNLRRVMAATSLLDGLIDLAAQADSALYLPREDYGQHFYYRLYRPLLDRGYDGGRAGRGTRHSPEPSDPAE